LHRPPAADGRSAQSALHRGSDQAHLRLHAGYAARNQQPVRRRPAGRVLQAGEGDRRKDRRRSDQGHGGSLLMVRMSDVVRGIVREKPADSATDASAPAAPPSPPAAPPSRPRPIAEVSRPAPPPPVEEERRPVEPGPSLDALPVEPEPPSESVEPL